MAERRRFDGSAGPFDTGAAFEADTYGGVLPLPRTSQQKRQLTAPDEDVEGDPRQRYVPPATMDLLFRELAQRR